jgi:hypothetical protein
MVQDLLAKLGDAPREFLPQFLKKAIDTKKDEEVRTLHSALVEYVKIKSQLVGGRTPEEAAYRAMDKVCAFLDLEFDPDLDEGGRSLLVDVSTMLNKVPDSSHYQKAFRDITGYSPL